MMKTRLLLTALAVPLLFSACGRTTENPTTKSDSLTVVTPWEITNNDPSTSGFIYQRLGIGETLVEVSNTGELIPSLATSWYTPDHGKTWHFVLRDGVKFHDGTPLTADAVANSLTITLKKPTALKNAHIQSIKAVDDKTLEFVLSEPMPSLPAYLTHSTAIILAKASFEGDNVKQLIATGAYKADLIEAPQKIEQSAFGDYWGDKAKISKITYLANSRSESRTLLVESSPNHLVYTLDSASVDRLKNNPKIQVATEHLARTIMLKVNGDNPFFKDKIVRQALSNAIDRQGIAKNVLRTEGSEAYEILPPIFKDWQLNTVNKATPDYTAIKQTLLDNGFSEGADGYLQKDGKPFGATLITFSDRPELPLIATALQDQWRKIGLKLEVSVTNSSEIPKAHQDGSLQIALYARNYGMVPDPLVALNEDLNPKGSDWGVMNWQNGELTLALQALSSTDDPAKQKELKQKITQILDDERPLIPVVYYQQSLATDKALQGVSLDVFERRYNLAKMHW